MRPYAFVPAATLLLGCKSPASTNAPPPSSTQAPITNVSNSATAPSVLASSARVPVQDTQAADPPANAGATSKPSRDVALGDGAFAASIYKAAPSVAGNRLISPLSIRVAFAMAYAGAKGETATEMYKTLGLEGAPDKVHDGFHSILVDFNGRAKTPDTAGMQDWKREEALAKVATLRVVNRIWGQTGREFVPAFKSTLEAKYAAPMEVLDIAKDTEGSRVRINEWVAEKTEKKIKDLIPKGMLTSATPLVLTNAVYFKAAWAEPFTDSRTASEDFFVDGTRAAKTPMMHGGGQRGYMETKDAAVLQLPYSDGSLSMVFVLPKSKTGLKAIEDSLKGSDFATWTSGLQRHLVMFAVPKFTFESGLPSLVESMKAIGMTRAFKFPDADFSGMDGTRELFIGAAVHKTFIDVNEAGTEAAAATALMARAGSAPPSDPPKSFVADHPFLFFIHDRKTDAILFVGRVTDPTKKG